MNNTVAEYIIETKYTTQEPKLLDVAQTLNLAEINKEMISTKGTSLNEDQSSRLIIPVNRFF